MNLEDCLLKPVTRAVSETLAWVNNQPGMGWRSDTAISKVTDEVLRAVRSHIKVNAAFRTVSDSLTGSMAVDVDHVEWHDDGELTVHLNYWPKPDQPSILNPDFEALEKADKRMSEMTPQEKDDSMELWMRKNLGWFTGDTQRHVTFLLNRLTKFRAKANAALVDQHAELEMNKRLLDKHLADLAWVQDDFNAGTLEIGDGLGETRSSAVTKVVRLLRQRVNEHEVQIMTQCADLDIIRAKADVLASDLEAVRFCKKKLEEGVKRAGFEIIAVDNGTVSLMNVGPVPGHDSANPAVASLTKQLKAAQAEVVNMTGKVHEAETENNALVKQLEDAQAANTELNTRLEASRAARTVTGGDLVAALKERDDLEARLSTSRQMSDGLKGDLNAVVDERDELREQLAKVQGERDGTCLGTETYWGLRLGGRYVLGTGTEIPVNVAETKDEADQRFPSFTPRQIKVVAFDVTLDDPK